VADSTIAFNDPAAYEDFMGPWSRAIGKEFLDWLAPPKRVHWLDIGCGSGAFTALVLDACAPASLVAVDPAAEQIDYARARPISRRATFQLADAQKLAFGDGTFDIVASALVMNFIPDRHRALCEMRRVCRHGGIVAGYVWDGASERVANWPLVRAMRKMGKEPPQVPGFASTSALQDCFERAGLVDIAVKPIEVTVRFADFDTYWRSHTPAFTPHGKIIAAMSDADRLKLIELVGAELPVQRDASVAYEARAIAIKSSVLS
jgi:ubiquinone/menaquinone biosynthesis C-methylase UbiE